jgi:peptidyl-tRNA hydrolase, PTH2 family
MSSSKREKQVIVIRKDLGMSPGKMIAQAAHAIAEGRRGHTRIKRVALYCDDEQALREICRQATAANISFSPVVDSGKTEVEPGTFTCAAIGPAEECDIDEITGRLSLI